MTYEIAYGIWHTSDERRDTRPTGSTNLRSPFVSPWPVLFKCNLICVPEICHARVELPVVVLVSCHSSHRSEIYHGPLNQPNQAKDLNKTKIVGFVSGSYASLGRQWYNHLETLEATTTISSFAPTTKLAIHSFTPRPTPTNTQHYRVEESNIQPAPPQ